MLGDELPHLGVALVRPGIENVVMLGFRMHEPALGFEMHAYISIGKHVQARHRVGGDLSSARLHQREMERAIEAAHGGLLSSCVDIE